MVEPGNKYPSHLRKSQEWLLRAERVIPLSTQTLSKAPTQFVSGVSPVYLQRGRGSRVWDVDGNEYVDFPMALGPVILGYAEPAVNEAIRRQLEDGITFTMMHPLEVEVSERIVALCPGVEAVRFGKSGSDVLTAAVRAARAHTGRSMVFVCGYHGWHDWFIGTTSRSRGVPSAVAALTIPFAFGDLDALQELLIRYEGRVAAVVLEPSGAVVPGDGYLQGVVNLTRQFGAVSIFDEVITGFRLAPGGARERYGVLPDLSCYGKALGNGMPIAAVAGSWSIMREFEDVFVSGTHGGETLALAAAATVLDTLADGAVLAEIEARGRRMLTGIADLIARHGIANRVVVGGEPQRAVVSFPGDTDFVVRSWVQQTLMQRGVIFNGSMFICARHTDKEIDDALNAFDIAFAALADSTDIGGLIKGGIVQPVFRVLA